MLVDFWPLLLAPFFDTFFCAVIHFEANTSSRGAAVAAVAGVTVAALAPGAAAATAPGPEKLLPCTN